MRILLETVPANFVTRLRDGSMANGVLHFSVQVFEAGEEGSVIGGGGRQPATAGEWLQQVNGQDKVVVQPPPQTPSAPPVEVPGAVLRALPADAKVVMEWNWRRLRS